MTSNGNIMDFSEAFKEAKQRLLIPELWKRLNLPGEPEKKCLSPFRDESNPSFSITKGGTRWRDHGAGKGGDIFDFYMEATGCSKPEATREIFKMLNMKADNSGLGWSQPPKKPAVVSLTTIPKAEPVDFYPALPDEAFPFLLSRGISPVTANHLLREGSLDVEGGKLVFVYNTGKKLRPLWDTSKENRWLEGGADDALWRYEEVLRPEVSVVFICEGESDCMRVLSAYGPIPKHVAVVAAPAASWRPSVLLASTIGHGRKVVLAFDNDEAGVDASERVGELLANHGAAVRCFPWTQIEKVLNVLAAKKPKDICCLPQNILHMALDSCFEP